MSDKQYEPGTLGHMLRLPYTEPTPPASQESAGEAVYQLECEMRGYTYWIDCDKATYEAEKKAGGPCRVLYTASAALTAELAEAREQLRQSQEIIDGFRAQSLRYKASMDECERLREALDDIAHSKNLTATPQQWADHLQREAKAALSASGRGCAAPAIAKQSEVGRG